MRTLLTIMGPPIARPAIAGLAIAWLVTAGLATADSGGWLGAAPRPLATRARHRP